MLKSQPRVFWWAVVSAALMIVGSFGPWARAFIVTVSGVDDRMALGFTFRLELEDGTPADPPTFRSAPG